MVRDTIRVTGLVKCQEACTDSRLFPCRSFAFSSSLSSSYNCYLSDRRASELDDRYDLVKDFDSVVYEKRDFCYDNRGRSDGKNNMQMMTCLLIGYIILCDFANLR